jgi:SAM-dependent methyltransferase
MTSIKPICIETDIHNQNFLKKKGFKVYKSLENINILFDSIFSCNVLEHIENDQEVISNLYDNIRIDGLLFLYVPAFQFLYSEMDKSVGHVRRYEKRELIRKVKKSGFKIVYCNYADSIGFFASIIIKFLGYDTNKGIGSVKSLIFYNKIVGLSFFLDNLVFKKFLGKNIVLLAKKQ